VVDEDGSEHAAQLWRTPHHASSSTLSYPEGRAALAAAHRADRLTAPAHRRAVEAFEGVHHQLHLITADPELARRAGGLADEHALRGYDAVHLATALRLGSDTILVTWDGALRSAALHAGLAASPAL